MVHTLPTRHVPRLVLSGSLIAVSALLNWIAVTVPIETKAIDRPGRLELIDPSSAAALHAADVMSPTDMAKSPLFHPDRKPHEIGAAARESEPSEVVGLRYVGFKLDELGRAHAFVRAADGPAVWVREGANVGGWTVRGIEPERVTLEARSRRDILRLYETAAQ